MNTSCDTLTTPIVQPSPNFEPSLINQPSPMARSAEPSGYRSPFDRQNAAYPDGSQTRHRAWGAVLTFTLLILTLLTCPQPARADTPIRIATFNVDATPPLGSALCDALVEPAKEIVDKLSCRGIVILGEDKPIVLCVLDWIGVGNGGHDAFRKALAEAAGTTIDRVAVHGTHAHDAPGCDFDAQKLLAEHGIPNAQFDPKFALDVIDRAAAALRETLKTPKTVTHIGTGRAKVENVASNRRVLGPDGKVKWIRWSSTRDPEARQQPEGVIDPYVHTISFWDGETPLVSMTYYAVHPQSFYGQGGVSCDFPGLARNLREKELPKVAHLHFNGAGGNITAGKYNDGHRDNRPVLTGRVAEGMKKAWEATKKTPVTAKDIRWRSVDVALPPATWLKEESLLATVSDPAKNVRFRVIAARQLAWLRLCKEGRKVNLCGLIIGPAAIVHLPGEIFVEYQLFAQGLRPDLFVTAAGYGDYAMGYIGTEISYTQGGYETGPASLVAPKVEPILHEAIRGLLDRNKD